LEQTRTLAVWLGQCAPDRGERRRVGVPLVQVVGDDTFAQPAFGRGAIDSLARHLRDFATVD
jgi:hypothetical protein